MIAVQNIDPVYIIQPSVVIAICVAFLAYWHRKRRFRLSVFGYSLLAYAVAIALKYAVQIPTIESVQNYFGAHSVGLGLYYGVQTSLFEVGLASLIAWWAVRKGKLGRNDAEGYGSGLAFWENGVLLGVLSLINLIAYYAILTTNSSIAQIVYNQLITAAPSLFDPFPQAFGAVAAGTVERLSSILVHFAWGYLSIIAAVYKRRLLVLIALPMGFVDFLVPFANSVSLYVFEGVVFVLSLAALCVALYAGMQVTRNLDGA